MNYQKLVCWGDSQTVGARTYGCYPLYVGKILNEKTRYSWYVHSLGTNGDTARDLWLRISKELLALTDIHQACILIGTNDVGNGTPLDLFEEYYRQILIGLQVNGYRVAFCGEIPPIWPDGNAHFSKKTAPRRDKYNQRVRQVVSESSIAQLIEFPALTSECYTDPVHLNESGNRVIAEHYADAIMNY